MDKQLRELERRASVDPSARPELLRAMYRAFPIPTDPQHLPHYLREINPLALESKLDFWSKSGVNEEARQFNAFVQRVVRKHVTQAGSGNFSELGFHKFDTAIIALSILKEFGVRRGLIISSHITQHGLDALQKNGVDPCPFIADTDRETGYDIIDHYQLSRNSLQNMTYQLVLVNEAHFLANINTKRSQAVFQIAKNAAYRIALTGVPVLNRIEDIHGLIRFMDPQYYETHDLKQLSEQETVDLLYRYGMRAVRPLHK